MNTTKEHVQEIVDKFWESEWKRIQSISLPDTRERPATKEHLRKEFISLCKNNLSNKAKSDIVHAFHPSIMTACRGGRLSPVEFWEKIKTDPELFKKFYTNRLLSSDWFKEKDNMKFLDKGYVPDFIYAIGCTTGHFAEAPSYFKPALAKNLLNKYAPNAKTVVDCFSGYSGRLLGALAAGMTYIGSDINDITAIESKKLIDWLEAEFPEYTGKAIISCADAFSSSGKADVFLSCPPYMKKSGPIEVWQSSTGKVVCEKSTDEIIDYILKNYECEEYILVFNASETKYVDYIKENLENVNYIGARNGKLTSASKNYESVIVITREERDELIT